MIYVHYVYLLVDPRDRQPFYVGKGKTAPGRIRRPSDMTKKSLEKENPKNARIKSILRDGKRPVYVLIADGLHESIAYAIQAILIGRYGRVDNYTGILTNTTDGGKEGNPYTSKKSPEQRKKMSESHIGMKYSDEVNKKKGLSGQKNNMSGLSRRRRRQNVRPLRKGMKLAYRRMIASGRTNVNSKVIHIFDPSSTLRHVCVGNMRQTCDQFGLPFNALYHSYHNNGAPIYMSETSTPPKRFKDFRGWYAVKVAETHESSRRPKTRCEKTSLGESE